MLGMEGQIQGAFACGRMEDQIQGHHRGRGLFHIPWGPLKISEQPVLPTEPHRSELCC